MRDQTTKLLKKLAKGGFRILNVSEWVSVKGTARLDVTVEFPESGQVVQFFYALRNGEYRNV